MSVFTEAMIEKLLNTQDVQNSRTDFPDESTRLKFVLDDGYTEVILDMNSDKSRFTVYVVDKLFNATYSMADAPNIEYALMFVNNVRTGIDRLDVIRVAMTNGNQAAVQMLLFMSPSVIA